VLRAAERQESIPEGIVADQAGQPITDARRAGEGVMLPFGGAKGSSLALFVELLAGVLSAGALSTEVRSMYADFTGPARVGHCFLAIDVGQVLAFDDYASRLELLLSEMSDAAPPTGAGVRLPGDERWAAMGRSGRVGVEVDGAVLTELRRLADRARIPLPVPCAGAAPEDR
jgi:LDH2 family malate/lactate/ureidoglycolate dehydrogenase